MDNAQKIAEQINLLLNKLVILAGEKPINKSNAKIILSAGAVPKGVAGALTILTNEGFFDSPKDISTIMKKLEEIGTYCQQTAVSMNLLNLAKRRTFTRLKDKKTKNWLYVLRK